MVIKNDIEIYSTHNEEKSVIAERFIRTLKNKSYKYMAFISKMCILITYIVNKFNNIYHRPIKMKPVDVKLSINIKFSKKKNNNNKEGPKLWS